MNKRVWLHIGGCCLAAALITGFSGCSKPISNVKDLVLTIGPKTKIQLVYIPALKCYVGKYEVSNKEFRCFKPKHDSGKHQELTLNDDEQPAVALSWNDANSFCTWMTKTFGGSQWRFRLPTEQEWMTAATCGRMTEYPWGDGPMPRKWNYFGRENPDIAKMKGHYDGFRVSCPVKKSGANDWGLYGVGGNVWEWCQDTDDEEGKTRVLKGASWADSAEMFLKTARRSSYTADYNTSKSIGFRIVAESAADAPKAKDEPAKPATPAKPEADATEK